MTFWLTDPGVLLTKPKIIPTVDSTDEERLNVLTILILIISLILYFIGFWYWFIFLILGLAMVVSIWFIGKKFYPNKFDNEISEVSLISEVK